VDKAVTVGTVRSFAGLRFSRLNHAATENVFVAVPGIQVSTSIFICQLHGPGRLFTLQASRDLHFFFLSARRAAERQRCQASCQSRLRERPCKNRVGSWLLAAAEAGRGNSSPAFMRIKTKGRSHSRALPVACVTRRCNTTSSAATGAQAPPVFGCQAFLALQRLMRQAEGHIHLDWERDLHPANARQSPADGTPLAQG